MDAYAAAAVSSSSATPRSTARLEGSVESLQDVNYKAESTVDSAAAALPDLRFLDIFMQSKVCWVTEGEKDVHKGGQLQLFSPFSKCRSYC